MNIGNLSFRILPRQRDQKILHLKKRTKHRQGVELLLEGWRGAYLQKVEISDLGDSGDVA